MIDRFFTYCKGVLENDAQQVQCLQEHGFKCGERQWCFTLPALFELLHDCSADQDPRAYKKFRTALFQSDINRQLMLIGAEIAIAENTGKVDRNHYLLRKKPSPYEACFE